MLITRECNSFLLKSNQFWQPHGTIGETVFVDWISFCVQQISAQESRRKKKEYMENLEKRMEGYCQENIDLKKKMEQLESNNR